jgi:hypothetical protein
MLIWKYPERKPAKRIGCQVAIVRMVEGNLVINIKNPEMLSELLEAPFGSAKYWLEDGLIRFERLVFDTVERGVIVKLRGYTASYDNFMERKLDWTPEELK